MAWQPPPFKDCDRCGTRIKGTSSLKKHKTTNECKAAWNRRRISDPNGLLVGLETWTGALAVEACELAGIQCERDALTFYRKGAYGRSARTEKKHIVPAWVGRLCAGSFEAYKGVQAPNGSIPNRQQLVAVTAIVLRRYHAEPAWRNVVDAAVALDGTRALWAFGLQIAAEKAAAKATA